MKVFDKDGLEIGIVVGWFQSSLYYSLYAVVQLYSKEHPIELRADNMYFNVLLGTYTYRG